MTDLLRIVESGQADLLLSPFLFRNNFGIFGQILDSIQEFTLTTLTDLPLVVRKLQQMTEADECARMMAGSDPWKTLRVSYNECIDLFMDPTKEVYLARLDNTIVGFIFIEMTGTFRGYIKNVGVMPEWRDKKVGSKLLKFAEERIFREAPNVFICVSSFNKKALKFYKKLGYKVVGKLKDFVVSGHSEIMLRKTISPLNEFNKGPIINLES